MTSDPLTATPSETVAEATARMRDRKVGSVVVVDGRRAIGILTERDLVKFAAAGADPSATKVSEWMTEDPDVVAPDVEVTDAWTSLAEHGYRHIPVVDGDALVGIVSMRDLMRIAQIRPVEGALQDVPKGLAGVVVAETEVGDVRGPGGLLPLPPVQRGRALRAAHARGRLAPAVRGPAARRGGARRVPRRDQAAACDTRIGEAVAARDRDRGRALHPARRAAHRGVARRATPATSAPASTSTGRRCAPTPCRPAR